MKKSILALLIVCAVVVAAGGRAEAFIGGTFVDPATGSYGHCSLTGAPCPFDFACPCFGIGTCGPGVFETCVADRVHGTDGESSAVQSGAYECKLKNSGPPPVKMNEDTALVLKNEHVATTLCACVILHDGQENFLVAGVTELSGNDVDEVNLCSLIAPPPAGGLSGGVKVVTAPGICAGNPFTTFQGGAYGWTKAVVYKGTKKNPTDPFSANVVATDKTELRVTPGGVDDGTAWTATCSAALPLPAPAYLENTLP